MQPSAVPLACAALALLAASASAFPVRKHLLGEVELHKSYNSERALAPAENASFNELFKALRQWKRHSRRTDLLKEALVYLRRFGYLRDALVLDPALVAQALAAFQQVAGVSPSGTVNRDTISRMRAPRCGNSDVPADDGLRRLKRFAQPVSRWTAQLDATDVLQLKWHIESYYAGMPREEIRAVVSRAFALWTGQVGVPSMRNVRLEFTEASSAAHADVNIMWADGEHGDAYPFDGDGGNGTNILAHTFYPKYEGSGALSGDIHFDAAELWVLDDGRDDDERARHFPYVLVHEIGHALGLGHSKQRRAVMNPIYKQANLDDVQLDIDDKCAVNWNYVGPTDMCLFVWLMVELLPRARDANTTAHGVGSAVLNENSVEESAADTTLQTDTIDERINATLASFRNATIPLCSESNDVQVKYEVLLENRLDFPTSRARQYGPVVCYFVDGLARMTGADGDDDVQLLTVHRYPHDGTLELTSADDARRRRRASSVFEWNYFDAAFYRRLLRLFVEQDSARRR